MLKIKVMSIVVMLFVSVLVIPIGASYASYGNSSNFAPSGSQSPSNQTMSSSNQNMSMSNKTMTTPMSNMTNSNMTKAISNKTNTNMTMTTSNHTMQSSNGTNDAQQISDFVHQAVTHFQSQKDETLKAIFACRDQLQQAAPSEIDRIHSDCKIQLNSINAKYQDERNHLQSLIKQYRQSVMVFLMDARGQTVDNATMNKALTNLNSMIHMNMSQNQMTNMTNHVPGNATTGNTTHA